MKRPLESSPTGGRVVARLAAAGQVLPDLPEPRGAYALARIDHCILQVSGTTDRGAAGVSNRGPLQEDVDLDPAKGSARLAALNVLAAAASVIDLDSLIGCVHLRGYVAAAPSFRRHPQVIDAASEVLHVAFAPAAPHTRAAIGVSSLPGGALVELEARFAIAP